MYDRDIISIFTERLILLGSWSQKPPVASEVKRELCFNKYLSSLLIIFLKGCLLLSSLIQNLYYHTELRASAASQLCFCLHICFHWFNLLFLFDNLDPFLFILSYFEEKKENLRTKRVSALEIKLAVLFYCLRSSPRNNLHNIAERQRNLNTERVNSLIKPRPPVLCNWRLDRVIRTLIYLGRY